MSCEILIDLATKKESHKFVQEWNTRYGRTHGMCRVKMNNHDFGWYPTVEITLGLFGARHNEAEELAIELADELELDY